MTERKIPPGEPDNKVPQEPSKDETSASAEEVPVEPNTPSTNDPQNDQPQPGDPDLLEKIRWVSSLSGLKQNNSS